MLQTHVGPQMNTRHAKDAQSQSVVPQRVLPPDMRPVVTEIRVDQTRAGLHQAARVPDNTSIDLGMNEMPQSSIDVNTDGDPSNHANTNRVSSAVNVGDRISDTSRPVSANEMASSVEVASHTNEPSGGDSTEDGSDGFNDVDESTNVNGNQHSVSSVNGDARSNLPDDASMSEMSHRSTDADIKDDQPIDVTSNELSDGSNDDGDTNSVPSSGQSSDLSPNRLEYTAPREEESRVSDTQGPDSSDTQGPDSSDTQGPVSSDTQGPDNGDTQGPDSGDTQGPDSGDTQGPDSIDRPVSPSEDSYKTAGRVDDVVPAQTGSSGDLTDEPNIFANVAQQDRETLQNLAFNIDVFDHKKRDDVKLAELEDRQQRRLTNGQATVPRGRDRTLTRSTETTTETDDEEQAETGGVEADSWMSNQQDVDATEDAISSPRQPVIPVDLGLTPGMWLSVCVASLLVMSV